MNLPNRLTIARFFLTLGFVTALSGQWQFGHTAALALFLAAVVTDYADGAIARRHNLITDFGKLMDPLVDKIMMAGAFVCLVPWGIIPAWAVVVIISREFLITGLRLLAASKGVVMPAEAIGKHKTGWQIATVIFFLLVLSTQEFAALQRFAPALDALQHYGGAVLISVSLVLTVYSGVGYLWKNRGLLAAG